MAPGTYTGPNGLLGSRYAATTTTTTQANSPWRPPSSSSSVIATREQIAASETALARRTDAALATAQNEALKSQLKQHTAAVDATLSSAVSNTRRLLSLLRDTVNKSGQADPAALKTLDGLWTELERVFAAAKEAQAALPAYLDKQRDNMKLEHHSMVNEIFREVQGELDQQHKKVKTQHDLILDQTEAFKDYKDRTESKLKSLVEFEERVSRLNLEKGLLKTEIDSYKKQLEEAKNIQADNVKTAEELRKELETAVMSKKELDSAHETLQRTVSDLQDNAKKGEELQKEIKELQSNVTAAKNETMQANAENEALQKKFEDMSSEHASISTKYKESSVAISDAMDKLATTQQENNKLKAQVDKLKADLDAAVQAATASSERLNKEISTLQEKLGAAQRQADSLKKDSELKIKNLEKDTDELEVELNDKLGELNELKKAVSKSKALQDENLKLQATVDELKKQKEQTAVSANDDSTVKLLKEQLRDSEAKNASMAQQASKLDEWKTLAERSYTQYKEMLPTYKQADMLRQTSAQKDEQIRQLEQALEAAKAGNSTSGAGDAGSAGYWKNKYETLLTSLN